MYAIVEIAGQQFKVEAGKEIFVNRLPQAKDSNVEFDKVLLLENEGKVKVGTPYVKGAVVKATVLDDSVKADKVIVSEAQTQRLQSSMAIARNFPRLKSTQSLKHYGTHERSIKF